jgi:hypothetical protein
VLRIYLDQNKWVDLARAATGHRLGGRFTDALALARAGVASGAVSFPLDMYRYWETSKRNDDRSRNEVVDVMRELSRDHTMALPFGILDEELDLALQRRFGQRANPRRQQVFGIGMRHISQGRMHWPTFNVNALPDGGASLPPGVRAQLEHAVTESVEEHLLRAGPATFHASGFDHAGSDHAQRYVDVENALATVIAQHRWSGQDVELAVRGSDFTDIRSALVEALERIDLTYEQFTSNASVGDMMAFMDDLPTRYVTNVMRAARHRQPQQKWMPNDFIDIVALPVAAVYCDVVITEKQWVQRMRLGKVDQRYNTVLLNDAADVVEVLVNASSA